MIVGGQESVMVAPVAIYGYGRFGSSLHSALLRAGAEPVIGVREGATHSPAAGYATGAAGLLDSLRPGSLVLLCVPDGAISDVARQFAQLPTAAGHAFAHVSGAHGSVELAPLAEAGALTGVFHILRSFPCADLSGSYATVSGRDEVLPQLEELAGFLGLNCVRLPDESRTEYHAAAVLACNALTTLLGEAIKLLRGIGVEESDARAMLGPLVQGTLDNTLNKGPEQALTGPVVRGDAETVERHLNALSSDTRELYVATMKATLRLAERSGRLDAEAAGVLRALLGGD